MVPPASHLALLSTITVHPLCTTRADKPDLVDGASHALDYLRNVLDIAGPVHADFRTAFQFHQISRWGRRAAFNSYANSDASDVDSEPEVERISSSLANVGSVWSRGQDFWSVLGWAMNCSVLYPRRWRYWLPWLAFMCDVLEADWDERTRIDGEEIDQAGDVPTTSREQSMILMYMEQSGGRAGNYKTVIKALLADASSLSSASFPEIFDKEPRGRKKESNKRKREDLDLENDKFGDYFDEDVASSGASEPPTPQKPRDPRKSPPFGVTNPGMAESIPIRLRLFKLVSLVTYTLRPSGELPSLYADFAVAIKLLPLPIFALIVSQRSNPLLPETHVTLLKELFYLLLPGAHKAPYKVDPEGEAMGSLTMPMMEQCFAIHAANTVAVDDNAKLSLVVESSLQFLWLANMIEYTANLSKAVERGIQAREGKVKKKRTGRAKAIEGEDAYSIEVLSNSSERIRQFLQVMEDDYESDG